MKFVYFISLLICFSIINAQSISGPSQVGINQVKTYTYSGPSGSGWRWEVTGGTIQGSASGFTINVEWSGTAGSGAVEFYESVFSADPVVRNVTKYLPPPTPSTPSISSNTCGNKTLTRANPTSGIVWYWQGTNANGTSFSNSSSTYTASSSGTYYLRAHRTSTGQWSTSSAARSATVNAYPSIPSSPAVSSNYCGHKTLTKGTSPGGITWYWQTSSSGTSQADPSPDYIVTSSRTVYLRARNNSTGCWSSSRAVSVTVNPTPYLATGSGDSRCGSGSVSLTASPGANGNAVRWYDSPTEGALLHTGNTYNLSLSTTTTFYAATYNTSTNCEAVNRRPITATINPIPSLATAATQFRCGSGSVILTATPGANGNTIKWYSSLSGDTLLHTGTSFLTPSLSASKTYYAASYNSSTACEDSDKIPVTAFINPLPSLASGNDQARCGSGTVTLNATPGTNSNSIQWYDHPSEGQPLWTGTSYTTESLSTSTTYYAASHNTATGCTDTDRVAIMAIISPMPSLATANDVERIGIGTINLTAIPGNHATTIRWYDHQNSLLYTGTSYTTPSLSSTTTYYAASYDEVNECEDLDRVSVEARILDVPLITSTISEIRPNQTATLGVSASYANYQWFSSDVEIQNGSNNQLTIDSPGAYKVKVTSSGGTTYTTEVTTIRSQFESNYNSIVSYTYRTPSTISDPFQLPVDDLSIVGEVFDGLGRSIQQVSVNANPDKNDIVLPMEYDKFGRQQKSFLPYPDAGKSSMFKSDALEEASGVYVGSRHHDYYLNISIHASDKAYAEKRFESSPMNRPLEQGAPGGGWQIGQNTMVYDYQVVQPNRVIIWNYESMLSASLSHYAKGQLFERITFDEDNNQMIEYTDKHGKTILKKSRVNDSTWAETYYIYDDYDQLAIVFPPEATSRLDVEFFGQSASVRTAFLNTWAFMYDYDGRGRMTMKKVPGADSVFMVYDQWDRLVLTQDGNQRDSSQWLFTKYDVLNRSVLTGLAMIAGSTQQVRDSVQASSHRSESFDAVGINQYTSLAYPADVLVDEYLTLTYYDHYNWDTTGLAYTNPAGLTQNPLVKGQVTGTLTKAGDGGWIKSVSYYDDKYRVIQTQSTNHLGGKDVITNYYDFIGQVDRTITEHIVGSDTTTLTRQFTYDHAGRLLKIWHRLNDGDSVMIVDHSYNELGELIEKDLHAGEQSIDYTYNIRGWLTSMNQSDLSASLDNDLFGMELYYNTNPVNASNTKFNGNISAMQWSGWSAGNRRAYDYAYDQLNRLTNATHFINGSSSANNPFDVSIPQYDLNGNILSLRRRAESTTSFMDDLNYTYNGNQLLRVSDIATDTTGFYDANTSGDDYAYDANGNMTQDLNKGITNIVYNHLNLPIKVTFQTAGDSITYLYDAAGIKLSQSVYKEGSLSKITDYIGGFIYETDSTAPRALQLIQHEEGRIVAKHEYEYGNSELQEIFFSDFITQPAELVSKNFATSVTNGSLRIAGSFLGGEGFAEFNFPIVDQKAYQLSFDFQSAIGNYMDVYINGVKKTTYGATTSEGGILDVSPQNPINFTGSGNSVVIRFENFYFSGAPGDTQTAITNVDNLSLKEEQPPIPEISGTTYDYQYHLKDHLDNVRLTFSTTPENYTAVAQFEDATLETDTAYFGNVDTPNRVNHPSTSNTGKAARLNGTLPAGPYTVISINKGDTINLSVNGYYEGGTGYSSSITSSFLESELANAFNSSKALAEGGVSPTQIDNGVAAAIAMLGVGGSSNDNVPGAYLNYLVFDKEMNFQNIAGFKQISSAASFSEETISLNNIIADREGYIIAYVSNESNSSNYVYFDDFTVYHGKTNVVSSQDYYPFGLTFNESVRVASTPQNYLYNNKELQEGTDWLDYGARMYQPKVGRFFNQDRYAEDYLNFTPYHYTMNNPILFVDVNGDSTVYYDNNGNQLWVSHDGLDNGVTFIDDNNILSFFEQLGKDLENDQSSDLRSFGTTYNVASFEAFSDANASDTKDENGNENPGGETNEHGTFLYKDENGEVVAGPENIQGGPGSIIFPGSDPAGSVGRLHTHDEDDRQNAIFTIRVAKRPSNTDMENHDNETGHYNVVVGTQNIYFYGNRNTQGTYDFISINRKRMFKKDE